MAYNEKHTQQVRELLAHIPNVEEKKMFGSIGFMINGKLCIGVGDHEDHNMMVRIGAEEHEEVLQRKGVLPAIMRGREMKDYVFLLNEAFETEEDLNYWIDLALRFNRKLSN